MRRYGSLININPFGPPEKAARKGKNAFKGLK